MRLTRIGCYRDSALLLLALLFPAATPAVQSTHDDATASHSFAYALVMPVLAYWLAEAQGHGVPGLLLAILIASVLSCTILCARLGWFKRAQP